MKIYEQTHGICGTCTTLHCGIVPFLLPRPRANLMVCVLYLCVMQGSTLIPPGVILSDVFTLPGDFNTCWLYCWKLLIHPLLHIYMMTQDAFTLLVSLWSII